MHTLVCLHTHTFALKLVWITIVHAVAGFSPLSPRCICRDIFCVMVRYAPCSSTTAKCIAIFHRVMCEPNHTSRCHSPCYGIQFSVRYLPFSHQVTRRVCHSDATGPTNYGLLDRCQMPGRFVTLGSAELIVVDTSEMEVSSSAYHPPPSNINHHHPSSSSDCCYRQY